MLNRGSSGAEKCSTGMELNLFDEYFKHVESCNLQLKLSISIFNNFSRCESRSELGIKSILCVNFEVKYKLNLFIKQKILNITLKF